MTAETADPVAKAVSQDIGKRKRGRPPKAQGDGRAPPAKRKVEEKVCFICFDGGNLVVCDRRDETFFRTVAGLGDLVEATDSIHKMAVHAMNPLVRHPLLEVADHWPAADSGRFHLLHFPLPFLLMVPSSSRLSAGTSTSRSIPSRGCFGIRAGMSLPSYFTHLFHPPLQSDRFAIHAKACVQLDRAAICCTSRIALRSMCMDHSMIRVDRDLIPSKLSPTQSNHSPSHSYFSLFDSHSNAGQTFKLSDIF